jgi:hypothetical protein
VLLLLFNANRQCKTKIRTLPRTGFHPDAPSMHFDNLFRNREPETGSALFLGTGAVGLMEFFEDPFLISL